VVETETEAAMKKKEEMLKEEMMKKKEEETKKMKADYEESIAKVVSEKDSVIAQMKTELDTANEVIAGYKAKEAEMLKKEKNMKRKASLLGCGFDEATSEATIEKFDSLADDAFDAMTTLFAGKMPPWLEKIKKGDDEETDKTKDGKKKASVEETVDSSALENVEVEETVNLGVGSDVQSSVDSTRAELIEFVCARLGKKN
jgi:hypothetical protein